MGPTDETHDKDIDRVAGDADSASDPGDMLCYDIVDMSDPSDSDETLEQRSRELRGEMEKAGTLDSQILAKLTAADRGGGAEQSVTKKRPGWLERMLSALGFLRTKGRLPHDPDKHAHDADG